MSSPLILSGRPFLYVCYAFIQKITLKCKDLESAGFPSLKCGSFNSTVGNKINHLTMLDN